MDPAANTPAETSSSLAGRSVPFADLTGQHRNAIRLATVAEGVTTLGPAPAAVIWTQGCAVGCRGCMSRDTWSAVGGAVADVVDVASWLGSLAGRSLVLSGGEPTEQSAALNSLLDRLDNEWLVTMYSGRDWPDLLADPDEELARLVRRVDLAIVGPYRRELHADLLWRGSTNQRIIAVSGRVTVPEHDHTAGVAVHVRRNGITAIGVPPRPDFDRHLRRELAANGVALLPLDECEFPFPVHHQ